MLPRPVPESLAFTVLQLRDQAATLAAEERRRAEKRLRHQIEDLRYALKKVKPSIEADTTYEVALPVMEELQEFKDLKSDEGRRQAFDRHIKRQKVRFTPARSALFLSFSPGPSCVRSSLIIGLDPVSQEKLRERERDLSDTESRASDRRHKGSQGKDREKDRDRSRRDKSHDPVLRVKDEVDRKRSVSPQKERGGYDRVDKDRGDRERERERDRDRDTEDSVGPPSKRERERASYDRPRDRERERDRDRDRERGDRERERDRGDSSRKRKGTDLDDVADVDRHGSSRHRERERDRTMSGSGKRDRERERDREGDRDRDRDSKRRSSRYEDGDDRKGGSPGANEGHRRSDRARDVGRRGDQDRDRDRDRNGESEDESVGRKDKSTSKNGRKSRKRGEREDEGDDDVDMVDGGESTKKKGGKGREDAMDVDADVDVDVKLTDEKVNGKAASEGERPSKVSFYSAYRTVLTAKLIAMPVPASPLAHGSLHPSRKRERRRVYMERTGTGPRPRMEVRRRRVRSDRIRCDATHWLRAFSLSTDFGPRWIGITYVTRPES